MYIEEWVLQAYLRRPVFLLEVSFYPKEIEEDLISRLAEEIQLEEDRRILKDLKDLCGLHHDPKFIETSFVFNPVLRPEDLKVKKEGP